MSVTLEDFLSWLDGYLNFERNPKKNIFWLDTMKFLCQRLGNPQNSFISIHIAGSKGKGSVAQMTASILTEAKIKTGLYTSPHITDFRERIRGADGFFSSEIYEKSAAEVMDCIKNIPSEDFPKGRPLTWFEIVTAFAFVCFKNAGCTHAVIETGLGGRLDSTNVLDTSLCVITRIEKEHTEFLGDTLEKIAFEKAGIIKPKIPVLVFSQEKNIMNVFRLKACDEGSDIYYSESEGTAQSLSYENTPSGICMNVLLKSPRFKNSITARLFLYGEFQAQNALLASLAVKILMPDFDESLISRGLSKAVLPGRFEVVKNPFNKNALVILDGAHTVSSVEHTLKTYDAIFEKKQKNLLFACASDKDVEGISSLFYGEFKSITLTKPGSIKSCDVTRMCAAFEKNELDFVLCEDFFKASVLSLKQAAEENLMLIVAGSFYLVSEVKKVLEDSSALKASAAF